MPSHPQIRGLLFDKDGTLLDFNRTWFDVVLRLARSIAPDDEDQARRLVEAGGYDWSTGRFRSGSVVAAGTVADLVDLWLPPTDPADRAAQVARFEELALAHVKPVPMRAPGRQSRRSGSTTSSRPSSGTIRCRGQNPLPTSCCCSRASPASIRRRWR